MVGGSVAHLLLVLFACHRAHEFAECRGDATCSMDSSPLKSMQHLRAVSVHVAKKTYPTGNKDFAVMQAFPAAVPAEVADPFLMCDEFGPSLSQGQELDPDRFPVGWHPHRGMDIMTYMVEGVGRHADSMGNREMFESPGMQWISVGSGIEHAEGGGTPAGESNHGFQVWINVPGKHKMEDPRYGTESPDNLPVVDVGPGGVARVLAGECNGGMGPFRTVQPVQVVDVAVAPHGRAVYDVTLDLDTCLVYVYKGEATVGGKTVPARHVAVMDATDGDVRTLEIAAGGEGCAAMVFSGQRIGEPIAWRGPFVMNTQEEIRATVSDYQRGNFPPVRAPWDYKRAAAAPHSSKPHAALN